jgi:hypothetical protein
MTAAAFIVRALLDFGCICFGLSVLVKRLEAIVGLRDAGCILFLIAGVIDLLRPWSAQ